MNSITQHERDHLANFKRLLGLIANTWAMLHTFEYRLFEKLRGHFAWRVKQALIFTIHALSNNLVFYMFQNQPSAFWIIFNFDSSCSFLKVTEGNLRSTFFVGHPVCKGLNPKKHLVKEENQCLAMLRHFRVLLLENL